MECRELRGRRRRRRNQDFFLPRVAFFHPSVSKVLLEKAASGMIHHGTVNHVAKVQGCSSGAEQENPGV